MKNPSYITQDNKVRWHFDEVINKKWTFGRLEICLRMTAGNGAMGRLGGGWLWKLGAMGSKSEIFLELIFFSLGMRILPK